MGDATTPPPRDLVGNDTFLDHAEFDGPTTDTVDDNRSTTSDDGEATDDDANYDLLTIDDDSSNDDDSIDSLLSWADNEDELDGLLEDQQMPPEVVAAVYNSSRGVSIANQLYDEKKFW